ncbi:hypothetical protein PanWU01x14_000400, partial [Parasponia andersonii]
QKSNFLLWQNDKSGNYSVKLGYKLALNKNLLRKGSCSSSLSGWSNFLWSLKLPIKVSIFVWRLFHEALSSLISSKGNSPLIHSMINAKIGAIVLCLTSCFTSIVRSLRSSLN